MTKHVWYNEIVAYANGETIQSKLLWDEDTEWADEDCPDFGASEWVFRIKEAEPNWWENIPERGVLVKDVFDNIVRIMATNNPRRWILLTNEEIEAFKR